MKPSAKKTTERDAELSEQCVRYLLDQMSEQERTNFEGRLATSPEMGDLLLSHAETIDHLSQAEFSVHPAPFNSETNGFRWMTLATSIALAACIGWALVSLPVSGPTDGTEDTSRIASRLEEDEALLIAKTWADDPAITTDVLVSYEDDNALSEFENSPELDAAPSWMITAMSFDNDSLDGEEENDG